ncbi:hypothetical protein [Streptomyces antnestii]|uniref:hypothetical protein n=1 Tax=Streptomyces antnestii TaxID=2494256 RepID=UPI001CB92C41|nr:hypothetical protein [Streptomyces sp. San01]
MSQTSAFSLPPMGRRAVLSGVAGALLGAAGCSSSAPRSAHPSGTTSPAARPTQGAAGTPSPTPSATLPRTTPWRPTSAEVDPAAKLRAVELVEAIGAWSRGQGGAAAARSRVTALGLPAALVDEAGPLRPSAQEAALQVIDAQYGGILSSSASVLVVCRQWTLNSGKLTAGGTTVDVRLVRSAHGWTVTALHPAAPGPGAASLASDIRAALADSRIVLPPAAEADLRSGNVHTSVAKAMLTLAGTYRLGVSVVRSGHPLDVFGTNRPSDHPRGRAFDVWQIDGRPVVDPATPRTLIERFMRDAAAAGSYNVGGPVRLQGGAVGQFFSDATHHDHVHVGFRT